MTAVVLILIVLFMTARCVAKLLPESRFSSGFTMFTSACLLATAVAGKPDAWSLIATSVPWRITLGIVGLFGIVYSGYELRRRARGRHK